MYIIIHVLNIIINILHCSSLPDLNCVFLKYNAQHACPYIKYSRQPLCSRSTDSIRETYAHDTPSCFYSGYRARSLGVRSDWRICWVCVAHGELAAHASAAYAPTNISVRVFTCVFSGFPLNYYFRPCAAILFSGTFRQRCSQACAKFVECTHAKVANPICVQFHVACML